MNDKIIGQVVNTVLEIRNIRQAVKYFSDKEVLSATRKLYGGKTDRSERNVDIVLKYGRPNFEQRGFIKKCQKSGEPFPIKKIQIKFTSKKK